MSSLEAIFLGIVQGLTEFLPVSSSGHLTIFKEFFGIEQNNLSFEVAVHAATVLSTVVVFWHEIVKLFTGFFSRGMNNEKRYVFMIIVSMIPVFVVGMFFKDKVEAVFGSGLMFVGMMLLVTALLLSLSEILTRKQMVKSVVSQRNGESCLGSEKVVKGQVAKGDMETSLNFKNTFIMGCAQAIAVLPGLSRSGSTISAGLICGAKKSEVAQFSFLMVLVPILGEAFLELVRGDFSSAESSIASLPLMLGFVSAFLSGLFACKVMINLVKRAKLWGFAVYCCIAGAVCIIYSICA